MATYKVLRHTHIATNAANFVFKEEFEWFAEFEVHLFRQTTYIVVALDNLTRVVDRLDDIWVDGTLTKPFSVGNLLSFLIKYLDKVAANDFAFLLRVSHASEVTIETRFSVYADDIEAEALVVAEYILKLIFAEQSVIHEDTGELVADSTVEEHSCDRAVYTTRESKDNAVGTDLLFKFSNGSLYEVSRSPILCAVTCVKHEWTELLNGRLLAFSDVEYWDARAELAEGVCEYLRLLYCILVARKDETDNVFVILWILVVRKDLAESVQLTNAASDDLGGF
jgi:hypothetical protein